MINIKPGVEFKFSPGGLMILQALKSISKMISHDLTITSGSDGLHFNGAQNFREKNEANPDDPHYHGDAYDVRSKDLDTVVKQQVLANLNNLLGREKFYYFLENPGTVTEHFHIQTKKGFHFTVQDLLEA